MNAGDTWDVPGVAFARSTGSENSIGPGMLVCLASSLSLPLHIREMEGVLTPRVYGVLV